MVLINDGTITDLHTKVALIAHPSKGGTHDVEKRLLVSTANLVADRSTMIPAHEARARLTQGDAR